MPKQYAFSAACVATTILLLTVGPTPHAEYRQPPQDVIDILDIPPTPELSTSPDGRWLVITEFGGLPGIEQRAVPMARLGGVRVNTRTNGPYDIPAYDERSSFTGRGVGYRIVRVSDGSSRPVEAPAARLGPPLWSPDSRFFAFLHTTTPGIELWIAEVASGEVRRLSGPAINAARSIDWQSDPPCTWMSDSERLLCHFVVDGRGAAPEEGVPTGPVTEETGGGRSPVWTFTNLLSRPIDEQLFDYYMTSAPAFVDVETGERTAVGRPAVYQVFKPSADGRYFLAVRIGTPYSYLVPADRFPKVVEVLDDSGEQKAIVAEVPVNLAGPAHLGWASSGPRSFAWRPGSPAALTYVEPMDGGDPKNTAEYRDRILMLEAPFDGEPVELTKTRTRIVSSDNYRPGKDLKFFADGRRALATEFDWGTRQSRTWLIHTDQPAARPELVFDHNTDDWYGHPGVPVTATNSSGEEVLLQDGSWIYLIGQGGSADGDHPFLDRFSLETRDTERMFQADGPVYEAVVSVLDRGASRIITSREDLERPTNYYIRDLDRGTSQAVTSIEPVEHALTRAAKQRVDYVRRDGIPLSGNLYLPPGYKKGDRLPVLVWAYPREYSSKDGAGQVRGSSYRYAGTSPRVTTDYMLFLTRGYAVLADAAMPIVGGLEANDTYVRQLVDNAQAAVDVLVDMGVADRERVGVAGLSYGAFMTVNLLAHSDIFAAGIAINGAYNRTLTPFGFQAERRTFWEAPEVYFRMSPFMHADQVNEPILILHGEIDSNTGTYPVQSQRMYHALNGHGATARLVMLPYEDHIYVARESRLHTLAEMFDWFDRYVKDAN